MLDFLGRGPREESRGGDRVGKELARISHGIFSQETSENLSLTLESSPFLLWTLTSANTALSGVSDSMWPSSQHDASRLLSCKERLVT